MHVKVLALEIGTAQSSCHAFCCGLLQADRTFVTWDLEPFCGLNGARRAPPDVKKETPTVRRPPGHVDKISFFEAWKSFVARL